jgi:hypothetical protein
LSVGRDFFQKKESLIFQKNKKFLQTQKTFVVLCKDNQKNILSIKNRMKNTISNITYLSTSANSAWWWHYIKDIGDKSCAF